MASLLGNLRVRLTAETEDFRRGMEGARQNLGSFQKDFQKFRTNTLANAASLGALALALKSSLDVANQYDNAQRQLAATSKLTGIGLGFLEQTSKAAQDQFKLSAISANAFTIEMSKLASKAGDVGKAGPGLQSFLDIGAARGLDAQQTLKAVQQSILGIDEGTDKLFSKNPSVLYAEFAAKIGTTAGKLTDQQKAQALIDAAMTDGSKVRGEYSRWLESSQGQQFLLGQSMEQTQAVLGKALQPALVAVLPIIAKMADGVQLAIRGWQMLGATLGMVPGLFRAAQEALKGNFAGAKAELEGTTAAWRETIAEIQASSVAVPTSLDIKPPKPTAIKNAAKDTAKKFFDSLETEWENLRNSVTMIGLEATGTDEQRSQQEETHQLNLLDIEEQHIKSRHKLKELTTYERDESLRQLQIKRELVLASRSETDAARKKNESLLASIERQAILRADALEMAKILNDGALARLGSEGSIEAKLRLQLDLIEKTYQINREVLLADKTLTDEQLKNEILKLDLAKEREEVLLRMLGITQRETKEAARKRQLKNDAENLAAGVIGSAIAGQGVDGRSLGSGLGGLAASAIGGALGGPIGLAVASSVGGVLGGLFTKRSKHTEQFFGPAIKGLSAIERAQRETITTIQAQTGQLLDPLNRLLNLPSNLNLPAYNYGFHVDGGSPVTRGPTSIGDTNITVNLTVNGSTASPRLVREEVEDVIGKILNRSRHNQGWL